MTAAVAGSWATPTALHEHDAAWREQRRYPVEEGGRLAADAEVPVEQQGGRPPARAWNPIEHRAGQHRRPAPAGDVERGGRDIDAEHRYAACGEREDVPPRPAADVEHRRRGAGEKGVVLGREHVHPAVGARRNGTSVDRSEAGGHCASVEE